MSGIDYSSSVIWVSPKTSHALQGPIAKSTSPGLSDTTSFACCFTHHITGNAAIQNKIQVVHMRLSSFVWFHFQFPLCSNTILLSYSCLWIITVRRQSKMKMLLQVGWNHFNLNFILRCKIQINYLLAHWCISYLLNCHTIIRRSFTSSSSSFTLQVRLQCTKWLRKVVTLCEELGPLTDVSS